MEKMSLLFQTDLMGRQIVSFATLINLYSQMRYGTVTRIDSLTHILLHQD